MKTTKNRSSKKTSSRLKSQTNKTNKQPKPRPKPKPDMKWQVDEYDRYAELKLFLPYQFLLLCKLFDTPPRDLIVDFLDNVSMGSWKRDGRDTAKELLLQYMLEMKYGQEIYTEADIRTMFREMDAVGLVFPTESKRKLLNLHSKWRNKYYHYWFKKWYKKMRRKE